MLHSFTCKQVSFLRVVNIIVEVWDTRVQCGDIPTDSGVRTPLLVEISSVAFPFFSFNHLRAREHDTSIPVDVIVKVE